MEAIELQLFGFNDPSPNAWKIKTLQKAYLLHLFGRLTPDVVTELQQEYNQWLTDKASQRDTFKDG